MTAIAPLVPPLRRFSVEQYHALADAGVLTEDDRVELLDGLIVEMPPIGPPHAYSVEHTDKDVLSPRLPPGWHIRMQQPITLATSEPEPDIAVVRGQRKQYAKRHPGPKDIGLLIEISDATIQIDRYKAKIYAGAGIPNYCIVDLARRQVEVYRNPQAARGKAVASYADKEILKPRDVLQISLQGQDLEIRVRDLFP
jgi:Uma2 family endonuclease